LDVELSNLQIVRLAAGVLGTVGVAAVLWGQQADGPRQGISLVTDWSHHHLVYSQQTGTDLSYAFRQEPRYWQQWLRRNGMQSPTLDQQTSDSLSGDSPATNPFPENAATPLTKPRKRFKRDWARSLGPGATVGAGQYPAKFSFDVTSANCGGATHPDFVAFNTSVPGSATQASIVAFDNLYSGCTGTVPATYWAYNTGGTVLTSTTLSLDGAQLAFVQSSAGHAQLVLLKWQASTTATSTSPGPINVVSASQYPTCTLPCMTTLAFSGGANDTNSSPFYDYSNDVLYAGDDGGTLHKFTPVFTTGTPSEVTTGSWPVTLAPGLKLSSPVYDAGTGRVFVGSGYSGSGSQLFAVVGTTGVTVGTSSSLGKGAGIFSGTLVDSSAGKVFVFVGNDGTTCFGFPCGAVYQFAANFTSGTGTKATAGLGGTFPLYDGDFDNAYYTSVNGTGSLYFCSGGLSAAEPPTIFRIQVTSGVMSTSSVAGPAIGTSNTACSPVTEVFNPAAGGTDRIFASVPNGSDVASCSSGGCINDLIVTTWQPSTSYTVGQRILDPNNYQQVVAIAGTSKSGSPPFWLETCGAQTTPDGTVNPVTWVNAGFLTPVAPQGWQASTVYSTGGSILDSNSNLECALVQNGQTGTTPPVWQTAIGAVTSDAGQTWRNVGPMASHALPVAGGASGIIMDNIVGSGVLAGASQVYFSTLSTGGCGAGNGCAIQASQSALN
jgi:hypothetical protein